MTNRKNTLDQVLLNQIITNRIGDHIKNTDNCFHEKNKSKKKFVIIIFQGKKIQYLNFNVQR